MLKSNKNQLSIFDIINDKEVPSIKCLKRSFENYTSKRTFKTDNDWMEWHANYMSSCLLMPKKTFKIVTQKVLKKLGINDNYIVLEQDFDTDEIADENMKMAQYDFKKVPFLSDDDISEMLSRMDEFQKWVCV